jgi:hypothetical protein
VLFGACLVFVARWLLPTDACRQREPSVSVAVSCGAALRVLSEKADESDAIFAKHVLSSFRVPDRLGRPEAKGAALKPNETVFRWVRSKLFVLLQKAKRAIWEGNRNPPGLELLSAGAKRGNYPEAKPKRDGPQRKICVQIKESDPC